MCMSKPSMPALPPPPPPPQEAKQASQAAAVGDTGAARKAMPKGASTLLTGPSGIENSQLNLGKTSLLGG